MAGERAWNAAQRVGEALPGLGREKQAVLLGPGALAREQVKEALSPSLCSSPLNAKLLSDNFLLDC